MPEPLLNIGAGPKLIPSSYKPTSSAQPYPSGYKPMEIDDAVVKGKPKAKPKPKSRTVEEQAAFDEIYDAIQPKPKPSPKPRPKPEAKASTPPVIKKPKVTTLPVTTGTRIPPSKIGIQKLRE